MATNTEVPEIKLSKVGEDRKRKKGGVVLPGAGGTGSGGFSGAVGGTVARGGIRGLIGMVHSVMGPGMAALLPKILTVAMVSCLGYGAMAVGKALRAAEEQRKGAPKAAQAFAVKPAAKPIEEGGIV